MIFVETIDTDKRPGICFLNKELLLFKYFKTVILFVFISVIAPMFCELYSIVVDSLLKFMFGDPHSLSHA